MSDFKKENIPQLIALAVSGQKIKDGGSLFRMRCEKLKNLFIEYETEDEESCHDMRWVVKMKTPSLSKLCTEKIIKP